MAPAHPIELTYPCCLPTLGELGEVPPRGEPSTTLPGFCGGARADGFEGLQWACSQGDATNRVRKLWITRLIRRVASGGRGTARDSASGGRSDRFVHLREQPFPSPGRR